MSTEKGRKKHKFARIERMKLIEYGCIALVILLFLALAFVYGTKKHAKNDPSASASPTPVPTADTSTRGMNVLAAIKDAGFDVDYYPDHCDVIPPENANSPVDITFTLRMESDDDGILLFSVETKLYPEPDDGTETEKMIAEENRETVAALRKLFDSVIPVFHRSLSDSNTIVTQCQKVVKTGEPFSRKWGDYTVSITSDLTVSPQKVIISLIRNP